MDNSLIELGYPLDADELKEAAAVVKASAIVLPDKLGDMETTVSLSVKAAYDLEFPPEGCGYLAVVQGKTFEEVSQCIFRFIHEIPHLGYLSIPRIVGNTLGSRIPTIQAAIEIMANFDLELPIHLLGFSDNLEDDFKALALPGVIGIDSAAPIWLGQRKQILNEDQALNVDLGRRPSNYMDTTATANFLDICHNLQIIKNWVYAANLIKAELELAGSKPTLAKLVEDSKPKEATKPF